MSKGFRYEFYRKNAIKNFRKIKYLLGLDFFFVPQTKVIKTNPKPATVERCHKPGIIHKALSLPKISSSWFSVD